MRTTDTHSTEHDTHSLRRLAYAAAVVAGLALVSPLAALPPSSAGRATISRDHAEKIAAAKLPMTYPVYAKFETWHGHEVYRVDLTVDQGLMVRHVIVDAHSGQVLEIYTTWGADGPYGNR